MYYLSKYIYHLLSATNQHGVHSPFVYNYLTKCLYAKPKYSASKSERVLLKSIPYFRIKNFKIESKNSQIENRISKEFGLKSTNESPFDLIYIENPQENIFSIYKDEVHNDSLIFIENIYTNKEASTRWETIQQNKMVTVSIDMFYCGILFFRKEQVKEHFKIRI